MQALKTCFLLLLSLSSCQSDKSQDEVITPKYSLAQWSFNRELFSGEMTSIDFVKAAGEMNFEAVEYVSQFFQNKVEDFIYLDSLNAAAKSAGVKNLMIQVDNIGNLSASDPAERDAAVALGKKWVDATKYLGCPIMRVNAHGDGTPEEMMTQSIAGIGALADYANTQGVQIIIENHGGISSHGIWLSELILKLSDKNVGSLDDFHNWCYQRENGDLWSSPCIKEYDYYQGFSELITSAEGISVKAFDFDSLGNESSMDFLKFYEVIKDSGYNGYFGIEYEGKNLNSREGILKTRALAERTWEKVSKK